MEPSGIRSAPVSQPTVTEQWYILISKTTKALMQAEIHSIDRAFEIARERQVNGSLDRVYLNLQPADYASSYRSEIIDGEIIYSDNALQSEWANIALEPMLLITRRNYWEAASAATLTLTNGAGTSGNTAAISNCQDATHEMYVEVDDDQVLGDIPTPAILEFLSTKNDANLMDSLYVGVFQEEGSSTAPAAGTLVCDVSGTVDATCCGGEYNTLSWADTTENQLCTWTLDSRDFLQKRYRVIARLQDAVVYTDLYLKAKLLTGTTVIAETRWDLVDDGKELQVIGTLTIPPYGTGEPIDVGNLTLGLYEKRAAGAGEIKLDYMILIPQDSWRRYSMISTGLAYNETLIDDPVRGVLLTEETGGGTYKVTHQVEEGEPLMLRPGEKNVLYFLQDTTTGVAAIDRTASVTVKAHARRLTL
jgi:hypothetical protein